MTGVSYGGFTGTATERYQRDFVAAIAEPVSVALLDTAGLGPAGGCSTSRVAPANATSLTLPDASYDVVLCQLGLMFMEDRAAAVAEMRRVLVDGGRVVISRARSIQPVFVVLEQALVDHLSPTSAASSGPCSPRTTPTSSPDSCATRGAAT